MGLNKILLQLSIYLLVTVPFAVQATFTIVATHPEASSRYYQYYQPAPWNTSRYGREIKTLRAFNNRLYIGYGQDDGHVKPGTCSPYYTSSAGGSYCDLVVRYYDPNTGLSSPQAYFRSQEMSTFEVLNGNLYILAEDKDGSAHYIKCTTSYCYPDSFDQGSGGHVYSATEMNGVLYMAGSTNPDDAAVWRSTNNGGYWPISLQLPPVIGYSDYARAYHIGGPYNGKLYVRPKDQINGSHYYTRVFNGSYWTTSHIPQLDSETRTNRMREFAGKMVYKTYYGKLRAYNGSTVEAGFYPSDIEDFTINGEWLYVLNSPVYSNSLAVVKRTKNLTNWQLVDYAPHESISIEVLNGLVYVGTENSEIYKSDVQPPDLVNIVPPVYLLLLSN